MATIHRYKRKRTKGNWITGAVIYHMMSLLGTICKFDENEEDYISYAERIEQYFLANDIDDATKKRAIFVCDWTSSL